MVKTLGPGLFNQRFYFFLYFFVETSICRQTYYIFFTGMTDETLFQADAAADTSFRYQSAD